jgi:hypothetical protein
MKKNTEDVLVYEENQAKNQKEKGKKTSKQHQQPRCT